MTMLPTERGCVGIVLTTGAQTHPFDQSILQPSPEGLLRSLVALQDLNTQKLGSLYFLGGALFHCRPEAHIYHEAITKRVTGWPEIYPDINPNSISYIPTTSDETRGDIRQMLRYHKKMYYPLPKLHVYTSDYHIPEVQRYFKKANPQAEVEYVPIQERSHQIFPTLAEAVFTPEFLSDVTKQRQLIQRVRQFDDVPLIRGLELGSLALEIYARLTRH